MTLKRSRFLQFIVASLLLHLSFVVTSWLVSQPKVVKENTITIDLVEPSTPTESRNVKVEKKAMKKSETLEKQVVEQDLKASTEDAPDTRFLSAQNQKVEKQTVAQNRGEFQNSKREAPPSDKNDKTDKKISMQSLAPKLRTFSTYDPEAQKQIDKNLDENPEKSQALGGSATSDYLKDVDQGLETLLNAREFKYYTYYNRIRKQLTQHWEPKVRTKLSQMFKQGRYLAAATDRITKLIVILDKKGNLVNVQLVKDSGVTDLDDAAVEAFQSAAPFPNPPQGIIDPDGTVKIRWDFVLES